MYFELDKNDIIYDEKHNPLYRIVSKENFKTVNPDGSGMLRNAVMIHKGDRGGYVGSAMCLEAKFGSRIYPWVFFPARISQGSVLSGMSVLDGCTEICGFSVIEGGAVIKDTFVEDSTISADKCASDGNDVLVSFLSDGSYSGRTEIRDTKITCGNVRISCSVIEDVGMECDYGNIFISNSSLKSLKIGKNVYISDTTMDGTGIDGACIPHNQTYKDGIRTESMASLGLVKLNGRYLTHREALSDISGENKQVRGIYRNVSYSPLRENC